MITFSKLGISDELAKAIEKLGYNTPTEIQEKTIPLIMDGKDVIGESATGSGKTLAFGCGIIERTIPKAGIQALVLTPTRELAEQVKEELREVTKLKIAAIYGGVSINPQFSDLRRCDIVVATPGRLIDHIERRTINLSKIRMLVLDEADRMLDMGFKDEVSKIISSCPKNRQTIFFSATISRSLDFLIKKYMKEPVKINAQKMVDPDKLTQIYYDVPRNMKQSLLVHLLKNEEHGLTMVFSNTIRNVEHIVTTLKAHNLNACPIHGNLTQNKRQRAIEMFNKGKFDALVCTDVAARGIHINNISHVYNYDIPQDANDYVHRIGRTARAEKTGEVINILCDRDYDNFSKILHKYKSEFKIHKEELPKMEKIQPVKMSEQRDQRRGSSFGSRRPRNGNRRSYGGSGSGGARRSFSDEGRSSGTGGERRSYSSGGRSSGTGGERRSYSSEGRSSGTGGERRSYSSGGRSSGPGGARRSSGGSRGSGFKPRNRSGSSNQKTNRR
jgi:superfamily II DNA/RNA helicase